MENSQTELIKSIESNSLDLLSDSTEIILDSTLESGILKDIPIFGSLLKIYRVGYSIKEQLFINKLKKFLMTISKIDSEKRSEFIVEHLGNEASKAEVGEKLLNVLDKIDSDKKAALVGKAFNLFVLRQVDAITFYDLVYTIENFKLHYTDIFMDTCLNIEYSKTKSEILDHFFTCGLLYSEKQNKVYFYEEGETKYSTDRLTDLGKVFLEQILEYDKGLLKKKFVEKILSVKYGDPSIYSDFSLVNTVTFEELRLILEKEEFAQLLNYTVYDTMVSVSKRKNYRMMLRNVDGSFSFYAATKKSEPQ